MKKIIYKEITMQDFKGIKSKTFGLANGRNIISGKNGIGKTTLAEAITYTLFGKGLVNERINHEPIVKNQIKENYDQKLSLTFLVDGEEFIVEKNVVAGKVKSMIINGKPFTKVNEFTAEIENILGIKEEEFIILTNPKQLNLLSNKESRNFILDLIESKSDIEIISDYKLDEEFRSRIIQNVSNGISINKQLELKRDELSATKSEIKRFETQLESKNETLGKISNVDSDFDKDKLVEERDRLTKELTEISKYNDEIVAKMVKKEKLINQLESMENKIFKTKDNEDVIKKLEDCRLKYDKVNSQPLKEFAKKCVVCGKEIDDESKLEKFKETALKEIEKKGISLTEEKKKIKKYNINQVREHEENDKNIEAIKVQISAISFDVEKKSTEFVQNQLNDVISAIGSYDAIETIKNEITRLSGKIEKFEKLIDKLADEEMHLTKIFEIKSKSISEKINAELQNVEIELFEVKKNGNIKEIFTIKSDGIDFARFNNAKQINGGIELLNLIQKYKDISLPIIVDNAESVNSLARTNSQTIELRVNESEEMEVKYG